VDDEQRVTGAEGDPTSAAPHARAPVRCAPTSTKSSLSVKKRARPLQVADVVVQRFNALDADACAGAAHDPKNSAGLQLAKG
jgi:hypothetical protein